VSVAPIDLHRLGPGNTSAYREIRLEALADSPHAFTSTLESEQAQPLDRFATRLADDVVLGAFSGPYLVGVAGFYIQPRPKHRHKGMLWGMYVRPNHRAAGIGRKLVEAIIEHARRHVELLQLFVIADNLPARRLYASFGFVEYGIERKATKYQGQYHDDVLMALPLVGDSAVEAEEISAEEVSA
jgi:RimJ/RimL family protein N-acetyltransferase